MIKGERKDRYLITGVETAGSPLGKESQSLIMYKNRFQMN
jgi:hypothetical protein